MDRFMKTLQFYNKVLAAIENNGTNDEYKILLPDWVTEFDINYVVERLRKYNLKPVIAVDSENQTLIITWER